MQIQTIRQLLDTTQKVLRGNANTARWL